MYFNKDDAAERRCHGVLALLDPIAAALSLDEKEARLFRAFADPAAFYELDNGRRDDVTSLFWKSEARLPEDKRFRAVVMGMVAGILYLPRGSHPMHTHLYQPHIINGTSRRGQQLQQRRGWRALRLWHGATAGHGCERAWHA